MRWITVALISTATSFAAIVVSVFTVAWTVFRFNPVQFVAELRAYIHTEDH